MYRCSFEYSVLSRIYSTVNTSSTMFSLLDSQILSKYYDSIYFSILFDLLYIPMLHVLHKYSTVFLNK